MIEKGMKMEEVKKKRYWLRGGVVLGALYILYYIITVIIIPVWEDSIRYGLVHFPGIMIGFATELIQLRVVVGASLTSKELVIFLILNTIIYFIIGAIIGLIYGKIKKRKKNVK